MSDASEHGPPIRVPPPLLYLVFFLLGMGLRSVLPGDALPPSVAVPGRWLGFALALAGFALSMTAAGTLFRAKTTVIPHRAASRLVIRGPFRVTRNPIYLGLTTFYTGLALALNRLWPLALLPFAFVILVRAVILLEERDLEERFGDEYRVYREQVRRFI